MNRLFIILLLASTSLFGRQPKKQSFELIKGVEITMIWVEPGTFMMGSPENELERRAHLEKPHQVTITKGFWLAETEFTQENWERIMGNNPSSIKGRDFPVESVSFYDIDALLKKINKKGASFRLPTEAEWEFACRAGTQSAYPIPRDQIAWHRGNANRQLHAVAQKKPNQWGFYDMNGNLLEWCSDWFQEDNTNESVDPKGPTSGTMRVQRGGQYTGRILHSRSADRQRSLPESRDFFVGFRLAMSGN